MGMDKNLNNNEKRVRKRLIIKKDFKDHTASGHNERTQENRNQDTGSDKFHSHGKPYDKSGGNFSGPPRNTGGYGNNRNSNPDQRPYQDRRPPNEQRPYGDRRQNNSEPRPFGEKRSFSPDSRPFHERRNQSSDRPYGEKRPYTPGAKPYGNKFNNDRKPGGFGNKRSFGNDIEDESSKYTFFKKYEAGKNANQDMDTTQKVEKSNDLIRLNKFISNSGICSRREADELIQKGQITVNGQVVSELGYKIKHDDKIEYRGKSLREANHVYILLNKPKDTITTTKDPNNRATVMDLVLRATDQRVFPIGRLDRNTTGVILLTNDGDFAQKLSHPSNEIKKVYLAMLDKPLLREDFEKLSEPVELEDGPMQVDEIAYVDPSDEKMIGLEIHSGKNRIVHRLFEHLGYKVRKLDRVVYAGLDKSGLRRGKWRFLRYDEVQRVLNSIKYHDK
jgi:23S rRNA pseudouridine2605 synthase